MISMMIEPNMSIHILGIDILSAIKELGLFENNIITLGSIIVIIFFSKAVFLFFFNIFELSLKKNMKISIANKLVNSYLKRPFIFFINSNSSTLSKNVITEVDQSITFITSLLSISREISVVLALFLVMLFF